MHQKDEEDGEQAAALAGIAPMNPDGTPNKDRHYRRRLPSFVETKCPYLSVRALIADIHDRIHQ